MPKGRPRFYNGHAITPARTRAYEKLVSEVAAKHCLAQEWVPLECDYDVKLTVYRARRTGDVENFAKSVLDGMNKIVYPDDRHVASIYVIRFEDKAAPRVEVEVLQRYFE